MFAQVQPFSLAGSGVIIGATTLTLKSFETIDGVALTMADFGAIGFGTLQPGEGTLEEQICFTGVTQNDNGTATLTGIKNVAFLAPYTQTSGVSKTHAGSTTFIISNTSGFYDRLTSKDDDENITGKWTFETVPASTEAPVDGTDLANKTYVLSVVNGGPVSMNAVVVSGTAGETLVAGNLVYLKVADGRWWKTDADTAGTVQAVQLGISQGAGTAGSSISSGVLLRGVDTNNTGTAGAFGYASNTAGEISSSTGTTERVVGQFLISSAGIYFDPDFYYVLTASQKTSFPSVGEKQAMAGGGNFGTPSTTNKFITQAYNASATGLPIVRVYTADNTWTKPATLKYAIVEVGGGGGGGGGSTSNNTGGGGGGGGGYSKKLLAASALSSSETVTVGAGGSGATAGTGTSGGASSFGSHVSVTGGAGGKATNAVTNSGGAGGGSADGDINVQGQAGGYGLVNTDDICIGGSGGNSVLGMGAPIGGGTGHSPTPGLDGQLYGGGGGGASNNDNTDTQGGGGAGGVVIVTEYYS